MFCQENLKELLSSATCIAELTSKAKQKSLQSVFKYILVHIDEC